MDAVLPSKGVIFARCLTTLGNEWFDEELIKQGNERHIAVSWAIDGKYEVTDPNKPIESRKLNGSALAYLHLAYDLYVLHNQGCHGP